MNDSMDEGVREALLELAADKSGDVARRKVCRVYADALAEVGQFLWVAGFTLGPDRVSADSPFGFGSDDVVGLATVTQIAGELSHGAVDLLDAENLYASQALIRQIVEVEYLASAFAEQDAIAAEWIRADRDERLKFWSPVELRKRAGGRYLREDYWIHCEKGGHPTPEALDLLPDHETPPTAFLWSDFAAHLHGIWSSLTKAIEVRSDRLPDEATASFPRVAAATSDWFEADDLTRVIRSMHFLFRRPSDGPSETPYSTEP